MSGIVRRPGVVTGPTGDRMAKFLEHYPKADQIYLTSGMDGDHGAVSHHYGLQYQGSATAALDIGAGNPPDAEQMRDLAKWLYDNYSEYTVELIHSTHFADDDGFYVKNQKKYPGGGIYGGPGVIGHFDHIHWATSADLLTRLEQSVGGAPVTNGHRAAHLISPAAGEPAALVGIANTAPVWGWDASDFDWGRGQMSLVDAQRDGISFFTHKATEGTTWKADHYKEALERARDAGIPVLGSYHFLWPENIEAQVTEWMNFVDAQTPWWRDVPWIWQIDAEKPNDHTRLPNPAEIGQAVDAVKRRMALQGTRGYVVVYAPRWAYGNTLGSGYDIWNSNYNGSGSPRPFKEQYQGVGDFQSGWDLMSGRKPRILQFASDSQIGTQKTCDVNKFDGDLYSLIQLCGRDAGRVGAPVAVQTTERLLPYDHSIKFVRQETGYFCGPAATQIVLNSRGINISEWDLAREIGTDEDGTDFVGLIERVLDRLVPDAQYTSVDMHDDPPTEAQRNSLWDNIVGSIDAGHGVVMNWVAPPNNYPRGVKGSVNPSYRGGTVFHYVACMGYDSNPTLRALWIADSGFSPFGYWVSFDQVATLIPPKAYSYATPAVVPAVPAPLAAPAPAPVAVTLPTVISVADSLGADGARPRRLEPVFAGPDGGLFVRIAANGVNGGADPNHQ